ncbi:GNAT family N-acetyltransferase [Romboutsia timonensis]|uniref:GNAT family N-acetyltransferase n=1 Tax=Romboutsia timonensis TaxID=1776391 RepID=UPI0039950029
MNKFSILNSKKKVDKDVWMKIWIESKQKEVFLNPNYIELYQEKEDETLCACYIDNETTIIYPFIKRPIDISIGDNKQYYDIITAYGYGGPYYTGIKCKDKENYFWDKFYTWCIEHNIVSEFIRFSLFEEELASYPGDVELNNLNVVCNLTKSNDDIWMGFKHKVRKNVKKAKSAGVTVEVDLNGDTIDSFIDIYYKTMDRNNANNSYYFSNEYFNKIINQLSDNFVIFNAIKDNKIIATELVLVSEDSMYSFLGGTDSEFYGIRPNDLLKYEMIMWGKNNSKKHYVLGGGYRPQDGIYKYKLGFEPDGVMEYKVGKRIFSEDIYNRIVDKHINTIGIKKEELIKQNFFPLYRIK